MCQEPLQPGVHKGLGIGYTQGTVGAERQLMRHSILRDKFFGRTQELERIERFLDEPSGGAILIAGDRGSGKTTLIMKALERLRSQHGGARKYTFDKDVVVHIPLILGTDASGDSPGYYRSLLMRTILRALDSDLRTRKYKHIDLPKRWFRSIGYVQSVQSMAPYAKYNSLNESMVSKLSLAPSGRVQAGAGIERALNGDIDISDASLEIKLRNLFSVYSGIHNFVIVLDELDKLDLAAARVQLEGIALFLKNLFSETDIHVIFISDEPPLGRILKKIASDPFCAEKTLFKDMILLNPLGPADFQELVLDEFPEITSITDQRQLVHGLAYRTNMMPSELRRFVRQNGRVEPLARLRSQLGGYSFNYRSTMQYYVSYVFDIEKGRYDEYHDRVLYKALVQAGENLLQTKVQYIKTSDYLTTLAITDDFRSNPDYELEVKGRNDWYEGFDHTGFSEVLQQCKALVADEADHVSRSIAHLICLLDRKDWLTLEKTSRATGMLELTHFHGDTFTLNNASTDASGAFNLTRVEKAALKEASNYHALYSSIHGEEIWANVRPLPIDSIRLLMDDAVVASTDYTSMLRSSWKDFVTQSEQAHAKIVNSLCARIRERLPSEAEVGVKGKEVSILLGDKNYALALNDKQSLGARTDQFKKYFIINRFQEKHLAKSRMNIKNYDLKKDLSNVDAILDSVASIVAPKAETSVSS